jgi:hypothetical protein
MVLITLSLAFHSCTTKYAVVEVEVSERCLLCLLGNNNRMTDFALNEYICYLFFTKVRTMLHL